MPPLRFGLIGYGAWGKHHARVIAQHARARLTAIAVSSEASQAAARADYPDAAVTDDFRALVRRADVDAAVVVLPTDLHYEAACAVLEAGKHLLLEKPMALTLEECDELIDLARRENRVLAIGHEFRLSSLWGAMRERVASGAIGEPRYALIELWRRPYRHGSGNWRYTSSRVGSWILEEPIHFFDFARWFFQGYGDPVSVYARANAHRPDRPDLQDDFSAILNFSNGGYAVISQTLAAYEHHQTVKIVGTRGALWANWSGALDRTFEPTFSLRHFDGETVRDVPITRLTGEVYELGDQIDRMVASVLDGTPVPVSGDDGRWSVALCLAAQQSVESGAPVPLAPYARRSLSSRNMSSDLSQLTEATVLTKANVYFDGNVVSHTVILAGNVKKTLGLIRPGSYHFDTGAPERMEIVAGTCRVTLDGAAPASAKNYGAATAFEVPGKSGFTIEVASGLCEYICSFLG